MSAPSPPLTEWHRAVASVSREKLLPLGLGAATNAANVNAFYGDKLLGAAVARELRHVEPNEEGYMTIVFEEATSNKNLAEKLRQILPTQSDGIADIISQHHQQHDAGTMVEAAVTAVHDAGGGDAAIRNLARWLVSQAISIAATHNSKGRLLGLGGKLEAVRIEGFPQHAPQFRAVATLNGKSAEAIGGTRKQAEMVASALLLDPERSGPQPSKPTLGGDANRPASSGVSSNSLATVNQQWESSGARSDSKSTLLNLGGHIDAIRLDGFPPHAPQFRAIATLNGATAEAP